MISLKNIFGFYPGNVMIYKLALLHRSAATEQNGHKLSNERLEYLGDAVLSSIVADYLFKKFPYKEEGFLTEMRSKLVSREQLNKLSNKMGIHQFIQSSQDSKSFFRSMTGDAFEALIGAIYLDKGYNFTRKVVVNRIINVHFDIDELEKFENNFKSKLIEWSQKERKEVKFNVVSEVGTGSKKQYVVEIVIDEKVYATGCDFSIKGAEKIASEKAFALLPVEEEPAI
ncbi:MAG: ribonuclease III [Bacteroidales bacterium]|nr:ribonuclease III [Bacteroidales bacterium]